MPTSKSHISGLKCDKNIILSLFQRSFSWIFQICCQNSCTIKTTIWFEQIHMTQASSTTRSAIEIVPTSKSHISGLKCDKNIILSLFQRSFSWIFQICCQNSCTIKTTIWFEQSKSQLKYKAGQTVLPYKWVEFLPYSRSLHVQLLMLHCAPLYVTAGKQSGLEQPDGVLYLWGSPTISTNEFNDFFPTVLF